MNKYEEVVNSCSGLIYMIIKKYFKGYDVEDLYQVGVMGVIKAYNNYKKDKGAAFSTYAYKYIHGEIFLYVNSNKLLKTSKETYSLYKQINEAKNILNQKLMREATIYEIASFLEIDVNTIQMVNISMSNIDSLDKIIYSDGKDVTLFDTLRDEKDYYDIDYILLNEELSKLPSPEKEVIYLRYFEDKTQSEVAKILGLSQVGVSRSESKTLKKIRNIYQNVA
ncbi:MAG: sigma-70 family RNA polymerase sigma factor [Bacilli bacterium]|nr:sigma-70 family RNA polymerase sigma factor [Bacilli bacterium]